jgi:hypothetical protein
VTVSPSRTRTVVAVVVGWSASPPLKRPRSMISWVKALYAAISAAATSSDGRSVVSGV